MEAKEIKSNKSETLYIALIGRIDAEIISEEWYINHGEYLDHYSIVKKSDEFNKYVDVFEGTEYSFRDENSDSTILKMYSFKAVGEYASPEYLKSLLEVYTDIPDDNVKYGDNKAYARTRKFD